jgi:hypothetical protein
MSEENSNQPEQTPQAEKKKKATTQAMALKGSAWQSREEGSQNHPYTQIWPREQLHQV